MFLLIATALPWLMTIIIWLCFDGHPITCGWGRDEFWLVNFVVDVRGHALFQYFPINLSRHDGAYCQLAHIGALDWQSVSLLRPKSIKTVGVSSVGLHLGLPLLLFGISSLALGFAPLYRQRRRRKGGLCIRCGYNLRGAASGICPECGETLDILENEPDILKKLKKAEAEIKAGKYTVWKPGEKTS